MTNQVEINKNFSKYKNSEYFQVQNWTKRTLIYSKDCSRTCTDCTFTWWCNSFWSWDHPSYTATTCPCTATKRRKHHHRTTQTGSLFDTAASANGNYSSAYVNREWVVTWHLWMVQWRHMLVCMWMFRGRWFLGRMFGWHFLWCWVWILCESVLFMYVYIKLLLWLLLCNYKCFWVRRKKLVFMV